MGFFRGPLDPYISKGVKAGVSKLRNSLRDKIEPPLDVERWVQAAGFVFGLPIGCVDIPEQALLDHALKHPQRLRPLAAARAYRPSEPYLHTLMVMPTLRKLSEGEFQSLIPTIGEKFAENNAPAYLVGGWERIMVGGRLAIRLKTEDVMDGAQYGTPGAALAATTCVIVCRRGKTYSIELCGLANQHDAYLPALDTVLGTWKWD
jgi:hypothetical protein